MLNFGRESLCDAIVPTNIGHKFSKIIDKSFPSNHPLHKILNWNTLKLSYSCMSNVANIIASHNKHILSKETQTQSNPPDSLSCNCRHKESCPLAGKCLTDRVVYQATVKREDNSKVETYIGITEGTFKSRYNNHTSSFRNPTQRNSTALSKYIWNLRDNNIKFSLKWQIIRRCKAYSSSTKKCNLCLHEKFLIICHPELSSLNSRNKLITTCRHRKKNLLCNIC